MLTFSAVCRNSFQSILILTGYRSANLRAGILIITNEYFSKIYCIRNEAHEVMPKFAWSLLKIFTLSSTPSSLFSGSHNPNMTNPDKTVVISTFHGCHLYVNLWSNL